MVITWSLLFGSPLEGDRTSFKDFCKSSFLMFSSKSLSSEPEMLRYTLKSSIKSSAYIYLILLPTYRCLLWYNIYRHLESTLTKAFPFIEYRMSHFSWWFEKPFLLWYLKSFVIVRSHSTYSKRFTRWMNGKYAWYFWYNRIKASRIVICKNFLFKHVSIYIIRKRKQKTH